MKIWLSIIGLLLATISFAGTGDVGHSNTGASGHTLEGRVRGYRIVIPDDVPSANDSVDVIRLAFRHRWYANTSPHGKCHYMALYKWSSSTTFTKLAQAEPASGVSECMTSNGNYGFWQFDMEDTVRVALEDVVYVCFWGTALTTEKTFSYYVESQKEHSSGDTIIQVGSVQDIGIVGWGSTITATKYADTAINVLLYYEYDDIVTGTRRRSVVGRE